MPEAKELLSKDPTFTAIVGGLFGSGKTHFGFTFPKVYNISIVDRGLEILLRKGNEDIRKNLVHYEIVNPSTDKELGEFFRKDLDMILQDVRDKAKEGKIKTILFDGFTYFVELKWRQINMDEQVKSDRTGNVDVQAMYRNLGIYLMRFVSRDLLPLTTQFGLNLVVTCHIKRESPEQIEGNKMRAGKVNKLSDISYMIEGSFRDKVGGLFGAMLFLETKVEGGKKIYYAYCDTTTGMRTLIQAKNRYGLPPVVKDVSYSKLMSSMDVKPNGGVK